MGDIIWVGEEDGEDVEAGSDHGPEEARSATYRRGRGLAGSLVGEHAGGCSAHHSGIGMELHRTRVSVIHLM